MKTLELVALCALLLSACDPPEAQPAPKEATAAPLPPPVATTPPPAPAPVTDVPATSKNPDAVAAYRQAFDL